MKIVWAISTCLLADIVMFMIRYSMLVAINRLGIYFQNSSCDVS